MNYIRPTENGQLVTEQTTEFLRIPCNLYGFHNTETIDGKAESGRTVFCFQGKLDLPESERCCECGKRMHINSHPDITLRHLCFGNTLTCVRFPHVQLRCSHCGAVKEQFIGFKAPDHMIAEPLYQYTRDLLAYETYTNKQVAEITGLGKNVIKEIDKKRLQEKYTIDGEKLIRPEQQAKYLGIDEFKLHDGHQYATHIIDVETGHILWIGKGKTKQIVYDFIDHVGMDWMEGVEAVACDMNSDFQEAFGDRCEWIQPVFDYFHIVKNFNDKVVSEIRKDEQNRLIKEGNIEAAKALKKTRFILTAKRSTLKKKDEEAADAKILHKGSRLFKTENIVRKGGQEAKYDELIRENKLLFTVDLIKEKLSEAYRMTDEAKMAEEIIDIMDICQATNNTHFLWFRNLLEKHFEGIIAHATYRISAGKIEGINQKIKTLRRHGYGYPDDEYFFLKLFDMSRQGYVRNVPSHRFYD